MTNSECLLNSLQTNQKVASQSFENLLAKIIRLKNNRPENLFVISDFDKTISRAHHNGKKAPGTMTVIEQHHAIPQAVKDFCRENFEKFYPVEMDTSLSREEKLPHMEQWWTSSLEKVIQADVLTEDSLKESILDKNSENLILLRDETEKFISRLGNSKVPLLVFSAGCGTVIEIVLKNSASTTCTTGTLKNSENGGDGESRKSQLWYEDTMVICSNNLIFDETEGGKLCGYQKPLIHSLNKCDALSRLSSSPGQANSYNKLRSLTNQKTSVIVLGDHINDVDMKVGMESTLGLPESAFSTKSSSFEDQTQDLVLNIGFLNHQPEKNLDNFLKRYDLVLVDDQSFGVVNEILAFIGV